MTEQEMTLAYYQENAVEFLKNTASVSFGEIQKQFLSYLPEGARIVDFGCGSGRDALSFANAGYSVLALDATPAFIDRLKSTGLKTRCQRFEHFADINAFDGVFACASLLHLPPDQLETVLDRIFHSLHSSGIFYCSMKQGEFCGMRNDRYFYDQTLESLQELLVRHGFEVLELFTSQDARPDREEEVWTNAIARKP